MPFAVLQPPKDEAQFAELGKEIYQAAKKLGLNMDAEGFLLAWVGGTRVFVERAADGQIVGLGLVALGKRWVQSDFTASALFFSGTDQLMDFILQICHALGATSLFKETGMLTRGQKQSTFEITEYHLQ